MLQTYTQRTRKTQEYLREMMLRLSSMHLSTVQEMQSLERSCEVGGLQVSDCELSSSPTTQLLNDALTVLNEHLREATSSVLMAEKSLCEETRSPEKYKHTKLSTLDYNARAR